MATQSHVKHCALCDQPEKLSKSHIIPRFIMKKVMDPSGKIFALDKRDIDKIRHNMHHTEYLLCGNCEQRFSVYENHFKSIMEGNYTAKHLIGDIYELSGIDYKKFKLFYLSLIWRFHASRRELFENVDLGPDAQKIAGRLLGEDPGDLKDYPLFLQKLKFTHSPGNEAEVITQPVETEYAGHSAYRMLLGGFDWTIAITEEPKEYLEECALSPAGTIKVKMSELADSDCQSALNRDPI